MAIFGRTATWAALLGSTVLLAGCGAMPNSGPSDSAIDGGAETRTASDDGTVGFKYALVDVNKGVLPFVSEDGQSLSKTFGAGRAPAPEIRIGVGDIVSVTVFESSAGGLFIPNDAGSRPGNYVQLPNQTIDRSGNLSVPMPARCRRSDGRCRRFRPRSSAASLRAPSNRRRS